MAQGFKFVKFHIMLMGIAKRCRGCTSHNAEDQPPADPLHVPDTPFLNLAVDTEAASGGERLKVAKRLKSGKLPEEDQIAAEMIKCSVAACITVWTMFFSLIWRTDEIPKDWTKRTLVKIVKR